MAAKFKRSGTHPLECEQCDAYVYATVASLEAHGMPICGCGGTFQPRRLELALMLGLEDLPIVRAYGAKIASVMHGQAPMVQRGQSDHLESPEFRALYGSDKEMGLLEQQREQARARRLAALGLGEKLVPDPENPRRKVRVRFKLDTEPMAF